MVGMRLKKKRALGTSDPTEANRLAANWKAELENLFHSIRQQIAADEVTRTPAVSQPVIPIGRSRKITRLDLDRIWVNEFENLEKEAVVERKELDEYEVTYNDSDDLAAVEEAKQDAISTLYYRFMDVKPMGNDVRAAIDWEQKAIDRLRLNGVKPSELPPLDLKYLAARLQEANAEVLLRTIDVAEGRQSRIHNSLLNKAVEDFKTAAFSQESHSGGATTKIGKTIGELGSEFLLIKSRTHLKTVEDGEYVTTMRIFYDFFGEQTQASEITEELCYEFMDFLKFVPSNIEKHYKEHSGMSLVKLSKLVLKMPSDKQHFLSPASQHKHFNRFVYMLSDPSDKNGLGRVKSCPLRNQKFRALLPKNY